MKIPYTVIKLKNGVVLRSVFYEYTREVYRTVKWALVEVLSLPEVEHK